MSDAVIKNHGKLAALFKATLDENAETVSGIVTATKVEGDLRVTTLSLTPEISVNIHTDRSYEGIKRGDMLIINAGTGEIKSRVSGASPAPAATRDTGDTSVPATTEKPKKAVTRSPGSHGCATMGKGAVNRHMA